MKNNIERLLDRAEELGWSITKKGDYQIGKFSPAGQDFSIYIEANDDPDLFVDNIYEKYENFDVSEETYLWLDESGHGKNGAPYDIMDLYNDMVECKKMILELHYELAILQ